MGQFYVLPIGRMYGGGRRAALMEHLIALVKGLYPRAGVDDVGVVVGARFE